MNIDALNKLVPVILAFGLACSAPQQIMRVQSETKLSALA